jgi:hypothetical protein
MVVISWHENVKYFRLNFDLLQQCYIDIGDHDGDKELPFGEQILQINEIFSMYELLILKILRRILP